MSNSDAKLHFTLGLQFVNLFQAGVYELEARNNRTIVVSTKLLSSEAYDKEIRWSDINVAVPLLFNLFHGVELILKGFHLLHGVSIPRTHKFSQLVEVFKDRPTAIEIEREIKALVEPREGSVLHNFFIKENKITVDQWYEALKYPELRKKTKHRASIEKSTEDNTKISHFPLKYLSESGLKDFVTLSQSIESIRKKVVAYQRTYETTRKTSDQVLITILSPLADNALGAQPVPPADTKNGKHDWQAFAGVLKNSTVFAGDPLAIQQQLRSEWR
jgi:hypothetical protein